jgi:VanZ family protein
MVSARLPFDYRWVRYGLVLFAAVGVTLLSVIHSPGTTTDIQCSQAVICLTTGPFGVIGADKWGHGIMYAILTATLAYAFVTPVRTNRPTRLALSVCFAVVFGICLEFVQWPIPNRTMSGIDAIANTIGASLLALVWWWRMQTDRSGDGNMVSS